MFFCKYNDPIYVKMEKLEIMIKLANERNIDQVFFLIMLLAVHRPVTDWQVLCRVPVPCTGVAGV